MEIQNSVLLENKFTREINLPENLSLHTNVNVGINKHKMNVANIKINVAGLDKSNDKKFDLSIKFFIKLNIKSEKYKKMKQKDLSYIIFHSSLDLIVKQVNLNFSAAKMPEMKREMFGTSK